MPGRHSTESAGRRTALVVGGIGVAVVAVAVTGVLLTRDGGVPAGCAEGLTLPVAAHPSLAPVVEDVVQAQQEAGTLDECVVVEVTAQESAALAQADVTQESPGLWVPESSMWGEQLAERVGDDVVENLGSMATTPLVLAATPASAAAVAGSEVDGAATVPWEQVLAGTVPVGVVDPESTTEGKATLGTLEVVLGGAPGEPPPENLVRSFVGLSRAVVPSVDEALALLAANENAPVVPTTEQSVLTAEGADVLLYPAQGTSYLDYPALRLNRPGDTSPIDATAQAIADGLMSEETAQAVQEAGFRAPDGSLGAAADLAENLPEQAPPNVSGASFAVVQDALRTWSAVTLEARMLAVIDVSGSMEQDAGQGRTRIELARDAAAAALRLYPESAQIGLWNFSILRDPPNDWDALVDLGALGDDVGSGMTQRELLLEEVAMLPASVGGGTGLYDTTLGSFRTVRAGYVPSRINSVVILTDGRNEDMEGIDLATLVRTLRAEFDPAQPVPIITIGMGPDADLEALREISEATGGKAYQALDPNDIETVFLDAMIERRCRPSC